MTETEAIKTKGKFIATLGRRKSATAAVRLYKNGSGLITVNNLPIAEYFKEDNLSSLVFQPLKLTGLMKDFNITALTSGGGKKAQAEAIRHGISRVLLAVNPELRPALKAKGYITRDARKKERKKPGLKKARRAPQWAKR